VAKDRARLKGELAPPVIARHDHPSAGYIGGHQIDRELDSVEAEIQREAQGFDQGGLAGTGHALDKHMAAGEEGA
jgi:hypothetical protein